MASPNNESPARIQMMLEGMRMHAESAVETTKNTQNTSTPLQLKTVSKRKYQIPTGFVRSALFGVVERGKKKFVKNKEIACWKGWTIRYTGSELDQYDEDTLMTLADMLRNNPDGIIRTSKRALLKACGKCGAGGDNITAIMNSITDLITATIEVKYHDKWYRGHIINSAAGDDSKDAIVIQMDVKMKWLWDNSTWIEKDVRMSLGSFQLAKKMYDYTCSQRASQNRPHKIGISRLMLLCGCKYKRERDFRKRLSVAMGRLSSVTDIEWNIENNVLKFWHI